MGGKNDIINFWNENYSKYVKEYNPYDKTNIIEQMAGLFSLGENFFYILNFSDLTFDYVSSSIESIVGLNRDEVSLDKLLATVSENDLDFVLKKEKTVKDFFFKFLSLKEIPLYKSIYTYKAQSLSGNLKTMVLQAVAIGFTEDMFPKHVLSIHTDISHLKSPVLDSVSFIHLRGGQSYYNISIDHDIFSLKSYNVSKDKWISSITKREKEIIFYLAKGHSTKIIADILSISIETVKTHRKNILAKVGSNNTAELISLCINAGVIF
ncbi:LuxR C-terminal-related transcriptional regulator [Aestuariibaculum sp. M13]|uniref:helix-turn-helix transcriptional regulator n=1 Tax=Aestuariibaculum sp. M13 TaxID=2967132 RepID=UPI002159CA2F|nr:LuxR C-terminal-related transcriptional regulator [Aestuariibaculum sp. M13]MCR8666199.1 LuxR C-terminal-related transcriptional regulator [Aestuariibaculum sp. M13]